MNYQLGGIATLERGQLEMWRAMFDERMKQKLSAAKVGLMKFKPVPGQYLYAVAVREDNNLWLALWIKKTYKGEIFVFMPRADRSWDPHTSYHLDGTLHAKTFGRAIHPQKHQPLTDQFRGAENVSSVTGFGPKTIGAICDPGLFTGVVEVVPGILGPRDGTIVVDIVEPNCDPTLFSSDPPVQQVVFQDSIPWIVVRVFS